jgi:hypothetical protein
MIPISKCVTGDQGYHVNGALVVAPEWALQGSVEQLKRIVEEFSSLQALLQEQRPCLKLWGPGFLGRYHFGPDQAEISAQEKTSAGHRSRRD